MARRIILISGAPGTGKSTLAMELSKKLDIPWISTDALRDFMRTMVSAEANPDLYHFPGKNPEEYLSSHSAEEILANQNAESRQVWKGVKNFIEALENNWNETYIIEGIAILPELVHEAYAGNSSVRALFLVDNNINRIRETIFKRGLWDSADAYPDSVKEKEVEWVVKFNQLMEEWIVKYPFPSIDISEREALVEDALKILEK